MLWKLEPYLAPERLGLLWGVAFFAGSQAQLIARLVGLPAVVLLLGVGLLIGRAGFGWVDPDVLGSGLKPAVGLLVSLVLFDGGLNLRLAGRDLQRTVVQLVLVRWVLGLAAAALAAHLLAGLSWSLAWVFAAIVLATGPTVVMPMVRQMNLVPRLGQVLEAEGLILEPVGAVLALLLLQLALGSLGGLAGRGHAAAGPPGHRGAARRPGRTAAVADPRAAHPERIPAAPSGATGGEWHPAPADPRGAVRAVQWV